MICPHCELDTPSTEERCLHCDGRLDVLFEEVESAERARAFKRRERLAEAQARFWLVLAGALFAVVLTARLVLVHDAPLTVVEPAFVVPAAEQATDPLPLQLPPVMVPTGE